MLCLIIAAIIGAIVGYLIGKMSRCGDQEDDTAPIQPQQEKKEKPKEPVNASAAGKTATTATAAATQTAAIASQRLSAQKHEVEQKANEAAAALQKNFDAIEGDRPEMLSAPRNGMADDLKEISGIGLKIEEVLNELGIYHFDQIANWTAENIRWIDNYLDFKGRVERENWVGQAKILAAGMPARHAAAAQAKRKTE